MSTAIEFDNLSHILDGFRLALEPAIPQVTPSPLYNISSMLLGRETEVLKSHGVRWSSFIAQMESFATKDYISIVEFPASNNAADLAGMTVSLVEDIIVRQTPLSRNVAIGMKYMVDECTDNILEHAQSDFGYIASRVDRGNSCLDICIADKGITVLGSYRSHHDSDISTDLEALQAANRGISTKNRPNAENRGYGLMTTKKMIVSGLHGAFAMISGGTIFVQNVSGRRFLDSSGTLKVNGTIIMMRFPFNNSDFKYIDFVE